MADLIGLHRQQGREALRELKMKPLGNLLTVLVLALSLSLPTTFFLLTKNVVAIKTDLQAPNQLTVFLKNMSAGKAQAFSSSLERWPTIASAEYISPEQGLRELQEMQGFAEAVNILDENPLPAAILIVPTQEGIAFSNNLAEQLLKETEVEDVRLDRDWLERLAAIESVAVILSSVFSGLMLMAAFLIIGNTLRLQILSQKEQIQVMKLVGATDSYILRPYLYMGMWLSVSGAFLAWIVTYVISELLDKAVDKLAVLYGSDFRLNGLGFDETMMLFCIAAFIGVFAARMAAGKHLTEIEPV